MAQKVPFCQPIGAQFVGDDLIALFQFEQSDSGAVLVTERHYRLVPADNVTEADLSTYRTRTTGG